MRQMAEVLETKPSHKSMFQVLLTLPPLMFLFTQACHVAKSQNNGAWKLASSTRRPCDITQQCLRLWLSGEGWVLVDILHHFLSASVSFPCPRHGNWEWDVGFLKARYTWDVRAMCLVQRGSDNCRQEIWVPDPSLVHPQPFSLAVLCHRCQH